MKISKPQALDLWNGSNTAMAAAIGVSVAAVSMWKSELTPQQTDRVIAAAWRGELLHLLEQFRNHSSGTLSAVETPVVCDERVGDGDGR